MCFFCFVFIFSPKPSFTANRGGRPIVSCNGNYTFLEGPTYSVLNPNIVHSVEIGDVLNADFECMYTSI